jgi:predicted ATP-grasp superfamily ATP-dependent carboligase
MSEIIELKPVGHLNEPVLITAFAIRRRAGRLANQALTYLIEQWGAEPVAKIETDRFYDFTVRRPDVALAPERSAITWPEPMVYIARPPKTGREFLLLKGFEPHFYWRGFVQAVADYMEAAGVKMLVNLRSLPGPVPHTRPAPVYVTSSDIELELRFGVQARESKYEGPTDIEGVLTAHVQTLRWQTADLLVLQPEYFPRMPNATATMALVSLIDRAFGTTTPLDQLKEAAISQRATVEEILQDDPETRSSIVEMEKAFDTGLERLDFLVPATNESISLPSSEDIIAEMEQFFRKTDEESESEERP